MSVSHYPHFFEPNQNGHNSVKFEARNSRFCMVVDLEEEDEDNIFFAEKNEEKDDERSEANPCGAAGFAKPR